MKKRNPWLVILYSIITLGVYFIYWFYATTRDMEEAAKKGIKPWLWTVSLIVPIWNVITYWRFSHLAEELTDKNVNKAICFIFFIFFFPVSLYLIQDGLNNKLDAESVKSDGVGKKKDVKTDETLKVEAAPKTEETKDDDVEAPKSEEGGPELY